MLELKYWRFYLKLFCKILNQKFVFQEICGGFHKKAKKIIFARSQSFNSKTIDDKTTENLEK